MLRKVRCRTVESRAWRCHAFGTTLQTHSDGTALKGDGLALRATYHTSQSPHTTHAHKGNSQSNKKHRTRDVFKSTNYAFSVKWPVSFTRLSHPENTFDSNDSFSFKSSDKVRLSFQLGVENQILDMSFLSFVHPSAMARTTSPRDRFPLVPFLGDTFSTHPLTFPCCFSGRHHESCSSILRP